jgi:hypothetical protein
LLYFSQATHRLENGAYTVSVLSLAAAKKADLPLSAEAPPKTLVPRMRVMRGGREAWYFDRHANVYSDFALAKHVGVFMPAGAAMHVHRQPDGAVVITTIHE